MISDDTIPDGLFREEPLDAFDDADPTGRVFVKLRRWLIQHRPHRMTGVLLSGSRGVGKTSVLRALARPAKDKADEALAARYHRAGGERCAILDLSLCRSPEEVGFDLIAHLEKFGHDGNQESLDKARMALARRVEPQRFLDLAKELTPARGRLAEDLARARQELARCDHDLAGALEEWARGLESPSGGRALLLLIDDMDLNPPLSVEIVELLARALHRVKGVAVLAADEPTLLRAFKQRMTEERRHHPGLEVAFQHKHLPLTFALRPWTGGQAARFLLDDHEDPPGGEVTVSSAFKGLVEPEVLTLLFTELNAAAAPEDGWFRGQALAGAPEALLPALLAELAPRHPRALKRLHNLLTLELAEGRQGTPGADHSALRRLEGLLRLPAERAPLALGLALAVDLRWPEARACSKLVEGQVSLADLRACADRRHRRDADASDREHPGDLAARIWGLQPDDPGPPDLLLHDALVLLSRALRLLSGHVAQRTVLAVSLDADAAALAAGSLVGVEAVRHLDLRAGQGGRPAVPAFADRVERVAELLSGLEVEARLARWDVVAKAPLSVLLWLGWRLRYVGLNQIFNDAGGRLTPFPLPARRPEARPGSEGLGLFTRLDLQAGGEGEAPEDEVALVIDALRRVQPADIEAMALPGPRRARRLQLKDIGRFIEPQDLPTLLQDLLDHITWLRQVEGVRRFHLAIVAPDVLAFGLGRVLHSQGHFVLYDWDRSAQRYLDTGLRFPEDGDLDDTIATRAV